MGYIEINELSTYAPDALITTGKEQTMINRASILIDEYLHRSIGITTYKERMKLTSGGSHLTYLPVVSLTSVKARYDIRSNPLYFGLAISQPTWEDIDPTVIDLDNNTGVFLILQANLNMMSLISQITNNYDKADVTYTAGYEVIPEKVKYACGQLITNMTMRPNAMATSEQLPNGLKVAYNSTSLFTPEIVALLSDFEAFTFR